MSVVRFGVSIEQDMLEDLDGYVRENALPNRSQAIRHLLEKYLVEKKWKCDNEVAGAIVLVYDHHKRDISNQIATMQHDYHHHILATQHVHLNHDSCLETITVRGKASQLTELADKLIGLKGVIHGKLVMSRVH